SAAGGSAAGGSAAGGSAAGGSAAGGSAAGGSAAGGSAMLDGGIEQILAVRALADSSPDGGPVAGSIVVEGVLVTVVKPAVDAGAGVVVEPEGFFVQADPSGPALFVAVPASTNGVQPGDLVSFTATAAGRNSGLRQVTSYTGFARSSMGNPVSPYSRSINAVDFTNAAAVTEWESRLISMAATITQPPSSAGNGYRAMNVATTGTPDAGTTLRFRVAASLVDSEDLQAGCNVSLTNGAMWRFNNGAQPSGFSVADLMGTTCPAPRVLSARADSATTVVVSFDRNIASATVQAPRFTFSALDGGAALTASAAVLTNAREATVTTNAMTGGSYEVTCSTMITDTRSTALGQNTAQFTGFSAGMCIPGVIISQVYGGGGNSGAPFTNDFVELRNRTASPVNLAGLSLQYQSATSMTWSGNVALTGTIPANGYFLVQFAGGTMGVALPTADQVVTVSPPNLSGTAGKVALVSGTTTLASQCPTSGLLDLVSYGTTTTMCAEGTSAPAPSNTTAIVRAVAGCSDTQNNSADFTAVAPTPRNSASPAGSTCNCP
ncbi:MAG: lamin tail domain-containing protein, partial [Myxococcales bacterium]|nr:lamin tail domain-containing protein [Myxococcales bacterium]